MDDETEAEGMGPSDLLLFLQNEIIEGSKIDQRRWAAFTVNEWLIIASALRRMCNAPRSRTRRPAAATVH